ncbi:flagellar biosynthetic protein FliO [Shewanella submarina]|uniref:Flagellar protein n=1 Tax=Shewanella submarina TaxID=2016376 RepID=A0ABV7GJI2_9GAMM
MMTIMAASAAAQTATPSSNLATMASMVGGLILVLLLIFALAFLVKRFNLVPSSNGKMKTLAVTPLGQKEKLVLVEVGEQQYLLGVTPHQINLIDKLEQPIDITPTSFAEQLQKVRSQQ